MPPTQPTRNGQSAIPAEISIPGFILATYSRSTDPAFAPRSIKHQPRISSSGYKRKVDTTSLDDAKRPKPEDMSTSSRDVSARNSRSSSLSIPAPNAVEQSIVSRSTNNPLTDVNNRSNTHTPSGPRSQTPTQVPCPPCLPIDSSPTHVSTTASNSTAALSATIANTTTGTANHPVRLRESPQILNNPKLDNPAEAALLAIFGRRKPSTAAIDSLHPASLYTDGRLSLPGTLEASQRDSHIETMPIHILSSAPNEPISSAAPPPAVQPQVIPTPPQTSVTADMGPYTPMIVNSPVKKAIKNPWIQEPQTSSADQVPATNPSQSSTSWYRSHTGVQTPPLTPATPASTSDSALVDDRGVAATAPTISKVPSTELDDIAKHTPEPEIEVPPIPLVAIATLQSVSEDLFMVLGKGDISNNENQLFAAAGKMSACLQAHFVPHLDVWRTEAMRPKAAMVIAPKEDGMISTAIQTSDIAETEADDMLSKAIQTIVTVEPDPEPEPEPEPSAAQRISSAIPQPETIAPTAKMPDVSKYSLGIPPSRDVVQKQLDVVQKELEAVQKQLHSTKVTILNQAEKIKVQAEESRRKDNVITRLQARSKQLEEENSRLALNAPKTVEVPSRHPSIGIMSKGMEVQQKEIEYLRTQLEIEQAHNIRLRDILQSNGISAGLKDDIHGEQRGMGDGRGSNQGVEDERRSDGVREHEVDNGRDHFADEGDTPRAADENASMDRGDNDRMTPISRPTTPTKIFSIKGHAQSPQALKSNTRRTSDGLAKQANLMADFTKLVAEKASRRVGGNGSVLDHLQIIPNQSYREDPLLSGSSNRSDVRTERSERFDQSGLNELDQRRSSSTAPKSVRSRTVRAVELEHDPRSPWERSRAEGKIIPTGPRSDRPATPPTAPTAPFPPPIGPRLPMTNGRDDDGVGAYYSKQKPGNNVASVTHAKMR